MAIEKNQNPGGRFGIRSRHWKKEFVNRMPEAAELQNSKSNEKWWWTTLHSCSTISLPARKLLPWCKKNCQGLLINLCCSPNYNDNFIFGNGILFPKLFWPFVRKYCSSDQEKLLKLEAEGNGILLPKLFWPTVRKKCSIGWEKLLKFEAEGREFAKFLRSLEQFIQTVKVQNNFW